MDQQHQPEQHYAGLDVSLDATSICVLDAKGAVVWVHDRSTESAASRPFFHAACDG